MTTKQQFDNLFTTNYDQLVFIASRNAKHGRITEPSDIVNNTYVRIVEAEGYKTIPTTEDGFMKYMTISMRNLTIDTLNKKMQSRESLFSEITYGDDTIEFDTIDSDWSAPFDAINDAIDRELQIQRGERTDENALVDGFKARLTQREFEVLKLMEQGIQTPNHICRALNIGKVTANNIIASIQRKALRYFGASYKANGYISYDSKANRPARDVYYMRDPKSPDEL